MASARSFAMLVLCALLPVPARAHALRVSTGDITVQGKQVHAALQFARAELDVLRPEEVARTIQVSSDGAPCALAASATTPAEEDGVLVDARWDCPAAPGQLEMVLGFLDRLPAGHVHVALFRLPGG